MALSPSSLLESVLFAEGGPLSKKRLGQILSIPTGEVTLAAHELRESLSGRGLALIETADEYELRTSPEASSVIEKLRESELTRDLGKAGTETLAIVLYQGGATRSEIDWIRGVNSSQTVRTLLMRGLVTRVEDSVDKRRYRYEATTEALAHLGVSSVNDLPRYAELSTGAREAIRAGEAENA